MRGQIWSFFKLKVLFNQFILLVQICLMVQKCHLFRHTTIKSAKNCVPIIPIPRTSCLANANFPGSGAAGQKHPSGGWRRAAQCRSSPPDLISGRAERRFCPRNVTPGGLGRNGRGQDWRSARGGQRSYLRPSADRRTETAHLGRQMGAEKFGSWDTAACILVQNVAL